MANTITKRELVNKICEELNSDLTQNDVLEVIQKAVDLITEALGNIGYAGDFTYEADAYLYPLPNDFGPNALSYMSQLARTLTARIDAARK